MITLSSEDTSGHLVAGRRAAYTAVLIAARQMANAEHTGQTDEQYAGGHILINGLDIGPAIDAAVLETLVRIESQLQNARDWQAALRMRPSPRKRFLTAYVQTLLAAAPWLALLGFYVLCYHIANWIHGT